MRKRLRRLNRILRTVSRFYGLTRSEVIGTSRKIHIVQARHVFCYVCYILGYTLNETANHINRDRNTARHSVQEVKDMMRVSEFNYDTNIMNDVQHLTKKLNRCRKIRR